MDSLKIYEIKNNYITYISSYDVHLYQNKKNGQKKERKFIGVVLQINGFDYFAPLSSFKEKHRRMRESLDFIKVKDYAVINLNNMFPVPLSEAKYVDIGSEKDRQYRALLLAEYRYIKSIQEKIRKMHKIFIKSRSKKAINHLLPSGVTILLCLKKRALIIQNSNNSNENRFTAESISFRHIIL